MKHVTMKRDLKTAYYYKFIDPCIISIKYDDVVECEFLIKWNGISLIFLACNGQSMCMQNESRTSRIY